MSINEQAKIILRELDKEYSISSYMEEFALRGIVAGLKKIKRMEEENDVETNHTN